VILLSRKQFAFCLWKRLALLMYEDFFLFEELFKHKFAIVFTLTYVRSIELLSFTSTHNEEIIHQDTHPTSRTNEK
jgi:hypothetical protein